MKQCMHLGWKQLLLSVVVLGASIGECSRCLAQEAKLTAEEIKQVYNLLATRCNDCHGGLDEKIPGLRVLDRDSLLTDRGEDLDRYVTPGHVDQSELFNRIDGGGMPPESSDYKELSEDEIDLFRRWIESGAEFPIADRTERAFVSDGDILHAIALHNFNAKRDDRGFLRYFSLANLHNNRSVTDRQLQLFKASLSKAINSMSRRSGIVIPEVVDGKDKDSYSNGRKGEETIFVIDLRRVGWEDLDAWDQVVSAYPYGVKPQDADALDDYKNLEENYGALFDGVPYIRADWFVAVATRPPLYHALAEIPNTLDELLEKFEIDVADNFDQKRLRRGGIFESGVSGQNRLVEVHPTSAGEFWLSYDFQRNNGKSNLARFPLGPTFEDDNRFEKFELFAFEHQGGEIIFNLPNRLSGYMLVDDNGNRIDVGPVDIVWDASENSGTPQIVNGISCMACHKHGMIDFQDRIRDGHALRFNNDAAAKVLDLYAPVDEMNRLLDRSRKNYLQSLEEAIGPFLQVGDDADKPIVRFPEPVSQLARFYDKPLDLQTTACELGMEDPTELRNQLGNKTLVQLGLDPLTKTDRPGEIGGRLDGKIKRSFWDSVEGSVSIFQQAAVELGVGTPINP